MRILKLPFKLFLILFVLVIHDLNSVAQATKITISEINYKSDKSRDAQDWIEIWNYGTAAADISNWVLQGEEFNEFFVIPFGTVMEADERLVFCRDEVKFKEVYPNVEYLGPFVFRLSGKGQHIRLYDDDNMLYLEMNYKDTLPWPKTPDGYGRTLELSDPEGDLNDGNNWFAGCILGSPGKAYSKCTEKLLFSEINSSSAPFPIDAGDWIELRNTGNQDMDISYWTFVNRKDTLEFLIPPNTVISPGEHLILARRDKFDDYYYNIGPVIKPFNFSIRRHNEVLRLYDAQGKIYISMYFHNEAPWPVEAGNDGITLELKDSSGVLCSGSNWFAGCMGGSPGDYYDPACIYSSVNSPSIAESIEKVFPNPFSEKTTIETKLVNFTANENIMLHIFDFTGKKAMKSLQYNKRQMELAENGIIRIPFQRNGLSPGIYFYRLSTESNASLGSGKMVVVN